MEESGNWWFGGPGLGEEEFGEIEEGGIWWVWEVTTVWGGQTGGPIGACGHEAVRLLADGVKGG